MERLTELAQTIEFEEKRAEIAERLREAGIVEVMQEIVPDGGLKDGMPFLGRDPISWGWQYQFGFEFRSGTQVGRHFTEVAFEVDGEIHHIDELTDEQTDLIIELTNELADLREERCPNIDQSLRRCW